MPPLLIFSINIIFQPSTSILSLPIFFISFSSYFPFSLRFLSPPLLVPPRYFRKGQDEKFTGETWYFFFSLQHSPLLRGKKNSQGILISHFLYNISFPDHPWALSSSTPQPLFATFQPTLAIGAREFFLYSFLFCKTILFTPRLHKLHFYVFFYSSTFFPLFFFSTLAFYVKWEKIRFFCVKKHLTFLSVFFPFSPHFIRRVISNEKIWLPLKYILLAAKYGDVDKGRGSHHIAVERNNQDKQLILQYM